MSTSKLFTTYNQGAFELVSVAGIAVGLADATINPTSGIAANKTARHIIVTPEDGDIRILMTGETPTNTPKKGTKLAQGVSRVISGEYNIKNLKMLSLGGTVAVTVEAYFAALEREEQWPGIRE